MKRTVTLLLILVSALAATGAVLANSSVTLAFSVRGSGGATVCPQGTNFADGCSSAVAALTSFPSTFSGYATRPQWNVAGVDYAVGVPASVSLQDPTTATLPTGVSYSSAAHTVTITGNGVTLTGFDFSLHNGIQVDVMGANDIISNSKFVLGTNQCPTPGTCGGTSAALVNFQPSSSSPSLINCELDGASIETTNQNGQLVNVYSQGTVTFKYNYIHNTGEDGIDLWNSSASRKDVIRYNLFTAIGTSNVHSDAVQWFGTTNGTGSSVAFDTVILNTALDGGGNGALTTLSEGTGATMTGMDLTNNTIIMTTSCGTGCNWSTGYYQDDGGVGDHVSIRHSYTDYTGLASTTNSPWIALGHHGSLPATFTLAVPMIENGLIDLTTGSNIPSPTFTSQTNFGYWVCPDANSYCPSTSDIFEIDASPATGNVTTGNTVTLTLSMPIVGLAPGDTPGWKVLGTPTLSLNSGSTVATYTSGSGTNSLVFTYTVGSGDTTTNLAVTAINLAGGSITDAYGNAAILTGPLTTFAGLGINHTTPPTLTFTTMANAATNATASISGAYTVAAPSGLTSATYGGGCSGSSTITGFAASGGTWSATATTPTSACTGTLAVTGTGSNTNTATGPSAAFAVPTLTFASLTAASTGSTTSGSGTYTIAAPTGLTSAVYNSPCSGSSTVTGFSASGGNWSATFTTPASACTGTLSATATGVNTATATSPSTAFTTPGGGTPVITTTTASFTGSVATSAGISLLTTGTVTGTMTYNDLLFQSGTFLARLINNKTGAVWNLDTNLGTVSSGALTSQTPIYASSTSGTTAGTPPAVGTARAQASQVLTTAFGCHFCSSGALVTSNSPTSYAIVSCSTAAGDCEGRTGGPWFDVSNAGVITVTTNGAANITPSFTGTLYTLTVTATNGSGTGPSAIIPIVFFNDGALSAPAGGTVDNSTLYSSSYSFRPPWKVAGVDYGLGPPSSTTFNVVASGNAPSGCTISGHNVNCTTTGGTINGWDFTQNGCWSLQLNANNMTVTNNLLGCATNVTTVPLLQNGNNEYIAYNTFNQNHFSDGTFGGLVFQRVSSGTGWFMEYNRTLNAGDDTFDTTGGPTTIRYGYSLNNGGISGGHPDILQNAGSNNMTAQISYMTVFQQEPPSGGSQGWNFADNTTPVTGLNYVRNSTMIALGSAGAINFWILPAEGGARVGTISYEFSNNYADDTAVLDAFSKTPGATQPNNYFNNVCLAGGVSCSGGAGVMIQTSF